MADNSPTDNGGTDTGADKTALPDNQTNNTAEEQHDTVSGGNTQDAVDTSKDTSSDTGTTGDDDGANADDDGLARFAKSQGFDPENLTDGEKKALKIAHDNQKAFREKSQKSNEDLKKVENEIYKPEVSDDADEYDKREAARDYQLNMLAANQRKRDFFDAVPEAKEYEADMAQLIKTEAENNGVDAARYLASDLRRVFILAKAGKSDDEIRTASEAARREERELLRHKQEAGSDASAATSNQRKSPKVTRDWIKTEYDPGNEEHRKMVDEAIARGDLY